MTTPLFCFILICMRKSLKKICAACGAVFLFASCATTKLRPVYVTNTTKVQLLPTDAVKTEIDDYYLFEGVFGDKVFSSLAYLTMNSKETTVVMLSGLGVTLGEIIYDGKICTIDSAVIPDKLKPEYIVLDLQNAFADFGKLKNHYESSGISFAETVSCPAEGGEKATVRIISKGKDEIERIEITKKSVLVKNNLRKYEYRLTRSEE